MFEAHFTEEEDFQGPEANTHSWDKTYFRRHKTSLQPLRIWFAWGKRDSKSAGLTRRLFIYIEYKDARDKHQYHCLETDASFSVEQALGLAVNADLKRY